MQMVKVHKMAKEDMLERAAGLEDEDAKDIRDAYPLMDAIAHREGWDDPEMDSYDFYTRRPHESAT